MLIKKYLFLVSLAIYLEFHNFQGNIVLIERGECSFVSKAIRAQEAGAVAAIITGEVSHIITINQ
jgi:hypothetical protein